MGPWLQKFVGAEGLATFGGAGLITVLVLILVLRIVLARSERRYLRALLVLFVGNVVLVAARASLTLAPMLDRIFEVLAVVLLLAAIVRGSFLLVVDWFLGKRLQRPMPKIIRDVLQVFVYVGIAFVTLPLLGLEPGQVLTTSALLTAVIGLSMQETMGNLVAGLAIQAQRPFGVGDWIKFDQDERLTGRVTEINWRATKVITDEDVEVIIPNGTLAKVPIQNYTQPKPVNRRTVLVQGPYEAPPLKVISAIMDGLRGCPELVTKPGPEVLLRNFDDSGIEYWVRYHIRNFARRRQIDSTVRIRIWYALQREGISIPFPIRDVRHRDVASEAREASIASLADRRRVLTTIDFLAEVPGEVLDLLASKVRVELYAGGEEIICQGAEGDELFIVHHGEVSVLLGADLQRATEVARLGPGKVFGEMSLLTGEQRSATVVAAGPSELFVIGHDDLRALFEMEPQLPERFAEVIARRRTQLEERISSQRAPEESVKEESSALLARIKDFFSI